VDQCDRLQGVVGPLAPHVGLGQATLFLIDERERVLLSRAVAGANGLQKNGHPSLRLVIERIPCIVSPAVACQPSVRGFGTVGLPFTHYLVTTAGTKVLSN
jgi:hypothetical protein